MVIYTSANSTNVWNMLLPCGWLHVSDLCLGRVKIRPPERAGT